MREGAERSSFETQVLLPSARVFEGYDVVTFSSRTSPECSPLSCNGLASKVATSQHCLLPSLERAIELLERGEFRDGEPGPHRVFGVYSVAWAER